MTHPQYSRLEFFPFLRERTLGIVKLKTRVFVCLCSRLSVSLSIIHIGLFYSV